MNKEQDDERKRILKAELDLENKIDAGTISASAAESERKRLEAWRDKFESQFGPKHGSEWLSN